MPRPVITLTSDFGLSDHYVGAMKGVILRIQPAATIVDLTHGITPYEIPEAAYTISQSYRWFPKRTVHVVVVDPGVGTARRPLLVEAAGQFFVGPDNGVFEMIYSREKHKVRELSALRYFLKPLSHTFHGRDIFSPVAAHLTKGVKPASFGKQVRDYLRTDFEKPVRTGKRFWSGTIFKVDRFGSLITNFHIADFDVLRTRSFQMQVGLEYITKMVETYADAAPGQAVALVGSGGYIEVSANQGSAAKLLGVGAGSPVELTVY